MYILLAIVDICKCGFEVGGVVSWHTDVEGCVVGLSVCGLNYGFGPDIFYQEAMVSVED